MPLSFFVLGLLAVFSRFNVFTLASLGISFLSHTLPLFVGFTDLYYYVCFFTFYTKNQNARLRAFFTLLLSLFSS